MTTKNIQSLRLQKIEGNPGLLPVRQGQAYKQENKWIIIKVLDLSIIFRDLEFNINRYNEFDKLINVNKPYLLEFTNMKMEVEYLINNTIEKVRQIAPVKRFKRGLINPLGSFIKAISGNLDNNDAIRYDTLINKLHDKESLIESKITLVSKMMDYNINSTEILYNNSIIMSERLKRVEQMLNDIAAKENNSIYSTYVLGIYSTFINNFRSIYIKLNEIETSLAFGKISVLHQSIINSTELLYILLDIEKFHSLIYPVTESNLVKIEQTFIIKAYVKGNQITFIMEVPLTDNNTYNYYKIYSLPIFNTFRNETSIVIPEYPFLMVKGSKYLSLVAPCQQLSGDNQYLCTEHEIVPYATTTCTQQLMQFQENLSRCIRRVIQIEEVKAQRLSPARWIIYAQNEMVMTYNCKEDISKTTISGTYLLTIDPNCEMLLGDLHLIYFRHLMESYAYKVTPVIKLPEINQNYSTISSPIDIKGINLDDVKYLSAALKTKSVSESESENEPIIKVNSVSVGTLVLYLILIIIIIILIVNRFKTKIFTFNRNPQNPKSSDGFELKEGGVMLAHGMRTVQVNA